MVDDDKIKDLQKLSPQERIKRLRELEEKNKQEIDKARKIIAESEEELEIEEKLKQVEIPENEEVDVAKLFKPSEESLEETVRRERPKAREEDVRQQQEYLKEITTDRIERRAEYLQQRIEETGYINNQQMAEITAMYHEVREREQGLRQGTYKAISNAVEEQLSLAKRILSDIYRG